MKTIEELRNAYVTPIVEEHAECRWCDAGEFEEMLNEAYAEGAKAAQEWNEIKVMELKNGKFYEDGKEVPPEIGNVAQICLLQQAERKAQLEEKEGIEVNFDTRNFTFDVVAEFICSCGNRCGNYFESDYDDDPDDVDFNWFFDDETIKCPKCGRVYKINDGMAKMIKNA